MSVLTAGTTPCVKVNRLTLRPKIISLCLGLMTMIASEYVSNSPA